MKTSALITFAVAIAVSVTTAGVSAAQGPQPAPAAPSPAALEAAMGVPPGSPRDLTGIWMIRYRAFNYKPSPMTPWAEAQMKMHTPEKDPGATCLPPGEVRQMGAPYPMEIVMTPKIIYTLHEYQHEVRRIFMNETHPADLDATLMGHAIGKWDGNTLVVDTVGLDDETWLSPTGHPHSDQLHVVERFTKSADGKQLVIETTITDPKAYTAPWTTSNTYDARSDLQMMEYICQENNRDAPHQE